MPMPLDTGDLLCKLGELRAAVRMFYELGTEQHNLILTEEERADMLEHAWLLVRDLTDEAYNIANEIA
jgi:hypothetical protein